MESPPTGLEGRHFLRSSRLKLADAKRKNPVVPRSQRVDRSKRAGESGRFLAGEALRARDRPRSGEVLPAPGRFGL
jgi:hypothetical protein